MLRKTILAFAVVAPLASAACGGTSFVSEGGDAGSAGLGGTGAGGSTTGGSGGSVVTGGVGGVGGVGGTDTGGAGGSTGGVSGTSGAGMGGQAAGETGGASGLGGSGGCGFCPRIGCLSPISFSVTPGDQAGVIQDLTIDAPEALAIECFPNGGTPCSWWCHSVAFNLPYGQYSITLAAPGFSPETISFEAKAPEACSCGCQSFLQTSVVLDATMDAQGGCCADTRDDLLNCGACGNACTSNLCTDGECVP